MTNIINQFLDLSEHAFAADPASGKNTRELIIDLMQSDNDGRRDLPYKTTVTVKLSGSEIFCNILYMNQIAIVYNPENIFIMKTLIQVNLYYFSYFAQSADIVFSIKVNAFFAVERINPCDFFVNRFYHEYYSLY